MKTKLLLILILLGGCAKEVEISAGATDTAGASAPTSLYAPLVTFNSGQLSPHMEARNDYDKYRASCRQLENMLITAQGPVTKRPGTKYIDVAGNTD